MKIRYIFLLTFAVFIDFLQAALGFMAFIIGASLQALTPYGGAAAGAGAGAYACFSSSGGIMQGIIDAAKCAAAGGVFGATASVFGVPIGIVLGFVFDIIVSLTFGTGLIFLLMILGMYSPVRVWANFLIELIPGLDVVPAWTLMVILCILKDRAKNKKDASNLQGGAVSTGTTAQIRTNTRQNIRTELHNIDGIKPAAAPQQSQSRPYVQKAA